MTNQFTENNLIEKTAIEIFQNLWWQNCFIDAFTKEGEEKLARNNRWEVVLTKFLEPKLRELNPDLPSEGILKALEIITQDRSTLSLERANKEIYDLLKDWVTVSYTDDDGNNEIAKVKVLDLETPENNDFILVSQLWITWELYTRRPDLIGFVNGIPMIFIELKWVGKNLKDAYYNNIKDYKDTIPQIFWYNAILIISNGIESKIWAITSWFEHFNDWKKVSDENETPKVSLETILKWTCEQTRFLDIFENFTLFDESKWNIIKIVARNHQYLWVNKALKNVENRKELQGKLWVFWHTQWSGKSYSMMFLTQKINRKFKWNFTFVIVTDRTELDKQIAKGYKNAWIVKTKETHAESVADLKKLLKADHRYIFTLIHKFQDPELLSDRDDIIIITDEAHRSQYSTLAMNMRISLPNASFIGFTWTPLIAEEKEKTKEVFWEYVSVYNFAQSVEDKATVPIYYENRVPEVENINPDLQAEIDKIQNSFNLNDEESEELEKKFQVWYKILTSEDRLNTIAKDIVKHYLERWNTWKAMVVSIDKKTAVRMYVKVNEELKNYRESIEKELKQKLTNTHKAELENRLEFLNELDTAVMISLWDNQNEIATFRELWIDFAPIKKRIQNDDLETNFKKTSYEPWEKKLKLVFVCSMWLTGFDVPDMTTLYLDKPLKNHTLMQTIARVNRVYKEKTNGLIVDYIWVFYNLQKALSIYASTEEWNQIWDIIKEKWELVIKLKQEQSEMSLFLRWLNLSLKDIFDANPLQKIQIIEDFVNTILTSEKTKKEFQNSFSKINLLYKAILPDVKASEFSEYIQLLNIINERIRSLSIDEYNLDEIKKEIEDLLDESLVTEKYKIEKKFEVKDLSKIDFEALKNYFASSRKNMQLESFKTAIEEKIEEMVQKNKSRKRFIDKLNLILWEYNAGSKNVDDTFNALITLAQLLNDEDRRWKMEWLSEEELALYDILLKEDISPDEEKKIKKIAHELLEKLRREKLVLDWRKKADTRASVKITIEDFLYDELPQSYNEVILKEKVDDVYFHVYDNYVGEWKSVYA